MFLCISSIWASSFIFGLVTSDSVRFPPEGKSFFHLITRTFLLTDYTWQVCSRSRKSVLRLLITNGRIKHIAFDCKLAGHYFANRQTANVISKRGFWVCVCVFFFYIAPLWHASCLLKGSIPKWIITCKIFDCCRWCIRFPMLVQVSHIKDIIHQLHLHFLASTI